VDLADYLRVIFQEANLTQNHFESFLDGLNDMELCYAYRKIRFLLFN
jgi:hypothetical protein